VGVPGKPWQQFPVQRLPWSWLGVRLEGSCGVPGSDQRAAGAGGEGPWVVEAGDEAEWE